MPIAWFDFADAEALDEALAAFVAERLEAALAARGAASLVVSGGRTPAGMFRRLSERELRWRSVTVTLADERCVAPGHPDSNEGAVRRDLLRGPAAAARLVPLWSPAATPEAAAARATARLEALAGPFDLVLLGVGEDGHTASLFPGAPELPGALEEGAAPACVAITPPAARHRRLSLNRAALLRTRALVLHVVGEAKRDVLSRAQEGGPMHELPVRLALQAVRVPRFVFCAAGAAHHRPAILEEGRA